MLSVTFSASAYDLETVKKAAYRLSDQASFNFEQNDLGIICSINPKSTLSESEANQLIHSLEDEVLDQDLRKRVAEQTQEYRNLILSYAFSRTGLQDSE